MAALTEALAVAERNQEQMYTAELCRLKGEITLKQFEDQRSKFKVEDDPESKAEECFWQAIEIACKQQAKFLELRATTSLARLWQSQGKEAEAHKLLSEVYNWFTEGFDTKDLQEAKGVLEELSH